MRVIHVVIGENYTEELRERLHKYGISQGELAREMGINPTQLTRWFNSKSQITGKPMEPTLENVRKIETALLAILKRKRKAKKK